VLNYIPHLFSLLTKSLIFKQKIGFLLDGTVPNGKKINFVITKKFPTMNKAELVEAIAMQAKLTKADAARALEATLESISKALKKEERVALVGFGSFNVKHRLSRTGVNPKTLKEIKIPAKNVVKFKAGFELSNKINNKKK
jgi:DNA-binding protein HU-beta